MKASRPISLTLAAALSVALFANPAPAKEKTSGPNAAIAPKEKTLKAAELFVPTKVWTVRLSFTPEQWAAMEPAGGPGGFGGPGGPGGGRGPGGGGGFSPAMFIAPAFLQQADDDHDGKISRAEFAALGEKWFAIWDKDKGGKVSGEQLRAGINAAFESRPGGGPGGAPGAGGPPGGGGAPGGPGGGGPGGRGFGGPPLQGKEGQRNGLASAMGIEFKYVHADLEFEGQPLKDVAVRYKGNGTFMESRGTLKRSFKLDLNKYSKGQKLAGLSSLNLHSCVTDPSWMNEVLAHRLYAEAGVPAPRTAYAKVYLSVPGKYENQYVGLYSLVEDIDKHFIEDHFSTKKGTLFKPVTPTLFSELGNDWSNYKQTYDPKDEVSAEEAQRVMEFCRLVSKADDATFASKLADFVELDAVARYLAVTVWISTLDSILTMGQNYYMYLNAETHKFQFLPWDLDHSFGQFPMVGSQEEREKLSLDKPWRGQNRFFERLFAVESFKKLYRAKLEEFSGSIFKPERFGPQVDELAAAIRGAVKEESAEKLARFEKAVAGEPLEDRGPGGPGMGGGQPRKPIKGFVQARAASVNEQLSGSAPGLSLDRPQQGRGGPGGPGGFGPGMFLGPAFLKILDKNGDALVTHEEATAGFGALFENWNASKSGVLSEEELKAGINKDLAPPRGGPGAPPPSPPTGN